MMFISWNARGINTYFKPNQVLFLLNSFKPTVIGLVENELTTDKMSIVFFKLDQKGDLIHNNDFGLKGRIVLLWDKSVWNLTVLHKSTQQIACKLDNLGGDMMYLTGLYASNMVLDRENLWLQLVNIASVVDNEGLRMRDFNNVEIPKDKKGTSCSFFSSQRICQLLTYMWPCRNYHARLSIYMEKEKGSYTC